VDRIRFGIVGTGWRSLFYLRVARGRPDLFEVTGLVSRDPAKKQAMAAEWHTSLFASVGELQKATSPEFVVTSVPWKVNPDLLKALAEKGMPALSETPPAPDYEGLAALNADIRRLKGKVQVAEEYHLRPRQAAQIALARGGSLGRISHAQVSVGHGYHGISLIRRLLGVKQEPVRITARKFTSSIVAGPGFDGPPREEKIKNSSQEFYIFDFGDRSGLLDFTGDQYFGYIRGERVLIRGERGELSNDSFVSLKDPATPLAGTLTRHHQDILTGVALRGIQAGDEWMYRNPFAPAAFTDDEIAVGGCLLGMHEYVKNGKPFYSLGEGSQDHYLYGKALEALKTESSIEVPTPPWPF
jgi:predicted dehydrogenase